jgi:hypothetical protein
MTEVSDISSRPQAAWQPVKPTFSCHFFVSKHTICFDFDRYFQ